MVKWIKSLTVNAGNPLNPSTVWKGVWCEGATEKSHSSSALFLAFAHIQWLYEYLLSITEFLFFYARHTALRVLDVT